MGKKALEGIQVVEFAGIGPGPLAGMMLADMGANVIVIERRTANALYDSFEGEDVGKLLIYNRGKRSITLDLKSEAGLKVARDLIGKADILVEGFRPGVMERLELGPTEALEMNPKLVYGRMTGWGQTGPLAKSAGHDANFLAVSGAMYYGGGLEHAPRAPVSIAGDAGGGTMILLWGIMCALVHSQKTGRGQVVDAAVCDGSAYTSSILWMMYHGGQMGGELGASWIDGSSPWSDTYPCADGKYITIQAVEKKFYLELLQRLSLTEDPLFKDQHDKKCWPEAKARIREIFLSKSREEWCETFAGSDACFAPVLNFAEAPEHPQNKERGTFIVREGLTQPAAAPKLSETCAEEGFVPRIGQHNEEILEELGYSEEEIAQLKSLGTI